MQTTIIHSCGHRETTQLYGSREARERREKWLDSQPCRACQNAARTSEATEQARVDTLPALTGTEKQVAWAMSIRAEVIASIDRRLATPTAQRNPGEAARGRAAAIMAISTQTSASWWIDHRSGDALSALDPAYQAAFAAQEAQAAQEAK